VYQPTANHNRRPPGPPGFEQAPPRGLEKGSWELGEMFWERAQITGGYRGRRISAMLVFYLPIIIFEAMFESSNSRPKPDVSTLPLGD